MERVEERKEEIRKMIDALYVREGSPSFVHQLKALLLQVEEFLRKINVRQLIHSFCHTLILSYTHSVIL